MPDPISSPEKESQRWNRGPSHEIIVTYNKPPIHGRALCLTCTDARAEKTVGRKRDFSSICLSGERQLGWVVNDPDSRTFQTELPEMLAALNAIEGLSAEFRTIGFDVSRTEFFQKAKRRSRE